MCCQGESLLGPYLPMAMCLMHSWFFFLIYYYECPYMHKSLRTNATKSKICFCPARVAVTWKIASIIWNFPPFSFYKARVATQFESQWKAAKLHIQQLLHKLHSPSDQTATLPYFLYAYRHCAKCESTEHFLLLDYCNPINPAIIRNFLQ